MRSHMHRVTTFVLYQLSLFLGIMLLPLALVIRQLGVTLPVHRMVSRFGTAYERAGSETA